VILRLDPGDERVSTTRHFRVWEGGGEYNVARGLRRCFGMETAIVTALADHPVGRLVEDPMLQGGVSQKYVRWAQYDGVGRIAAARATATSPSGSKTLMELTGQRKIGVSHFVPKRSTEQSSFATSIKRRERISIC